MPFVHVLNAYPVGTIGQETYEAVAHIAMPVGNNSAGVPWKTCYVSSFQGQPIVSQLKVVGNGPGQITQQELNSIQAGDIIEIGFQFGFADAVTDAEKLAKIDLYANRKIDEFKSNFAIAFKYYGLTRP